VAKSKGRKYTSKGRKRSSAKSIRKGGGKKREGKAVKGKKRRSKEEAETRRKKIVNYIQLFIALMIGVEGLDLTVTANKLVSVYPFMWGVGLLMVIGGFTWALYLIKPEIFEAKEEEEKVKKKKKKEPVKRKGPPTLAEKVMDRLTLGGRLTRFFPVLGIILIIIDLAYNMYYYGSISYEELGTHDVVALLFAGVLIAYPYIPQGWEKERDFAFFFSVGLILFLVIPLLVIRGLSARPEAAVDQYAAWLLARPLAEMLNLMGIEAYADEINLTFAISDGSLATLGITTSCSGIYSFTIFSAAFVSFVLVEYKRLKVRILGIMGLGVLTAYIANLLRMFIIVMVGHLYDTAETGLESTLWAHANAGWIIFLAWIALFWWLMFRFVIKRDKDAEFVEPKEGYEVIDLREDIFCSNCGLQIDNEDIPEKCPECGQGFDIDM
jgi:archaeosortase C (PEF-CTERM variant)